MPTSICWLFAVIMLILSGFNVIRVKEEVYADDFFVSLLNLAVTVILLVILIRMA